MSYCRFSEGDVYVFHAISGGLDCCGCILGAEEMFFTRSSMIAHLQEHIAAGHDVPDHVIPSLQDEIETIGDAVTDEIGFNA